MHANQIGLFTLPQPGTRRPDCVRALPRFIDRNGE